ncbi:MAG TPA: succinylglutamate desuccinylase, partial [Clostridiales bacterium]|nr:succinylglutamate desuccinylase [Clostridiales bacterium]
YIHAGSGQQLSGSETRNLNRCYPGRPDGNLMEKTAYAIVQLIKNEGVDLTFDLHESSPEY